MEIGKKKTVGLKCPHCLVNFHDNPQEKSIGEDVDGHWSIIQRWCPSCKRLVVHLAQEPAGPDSKILTLMKILTLIRPKSSSRSPVPPEVPPEFSRDYLEASLVLADSPRASAALSRRCLQHILEDKAGVKKPRLKDEIQEVLDSGRLPSQIAELLDAVRKIGNFAAHPIKSKSSGEIVEVEPDEAEWNLDVIEMLFDFFFVHPENNKKKKEALNQKLADAGKPPMK
jgi:hypothetical protein